MDKEQTAVNASAVVLAGGKSSRMGQAKALLPFGHEPFDRLRATSNVEWLKAE